MKNILILLTATLFMSAACGSKAASSGPATNTGAANTASDSKTTTTASTTGSPSATVKEIYEDAMKRKCDAIPPLLTAEFKKAVGTSKDDLEALCDSFTDSGKMTAYEVKSESIKGDTATVKVLQTYKDGRKEDKDERMKKDGDKWLMDS